MAPSFNAEILFSLKMVRLEGTATLARFTERALSWAIPRLPLKAVNTAAPVSPARNSRRFGSSWKTFSSLSLKGLIVGRLSFISGSPDSEHLNAYNHYSSSSLHLFSGG
jgi:hypothetical protein